MAISPLLTSYDLLLLLLLVYPPVVALGKAVEDGEEKVSHHEEDELLEQPRQDGRSLLVAVARVVRAPVQLGLLLGHQVADGLLQRLSQAPRKVVQVAQQGGDQVVVEGQDHEEFLPEKIGKLLQKPVQE